MEVGCWSRMILLRSRWGYWNCRLSGTGRTKCSL